MNLSSNMSHLPLIYGLNLSKGTQTMLILLRPFKVAVWPHNHCTLNISVYPHTVSQVFLLHALLLVCIVRTSKISVCPITATKFEQDNILVHPGMSISNARWIWTHWCISLKFKYFHFSFCIPWLFVYTICTLFIFVCPITVTLID